MTDAAAQTGPRPKPLNRRLVTGAIVLLLGTAFWWTFEWMVIRWDRPGSYYTHGWLVGPISLGLLYLRRRELAATPLRTCLWGLLVLVPSLLLHLLATAWQVGFFSGFALLGALAGLILTLLGPAMLRKCLFPIAFLAFMVPLPDALVETLSFKLKLLAAGAATGVLGLAGVAAVRQGSYIRIPAGTVVVDDVCSGLKYLISLAAFGALFAYISRLRRALKVVLFALAVPVAFLANVVRVTLMVLVGNFIDIEATEKWYFHDAFGFALFATALLLMYGAESLLILAFGRAHAGAAGGAHEPPAADRPPGKAAGPGLGWATGRPGALAGALALGLALVAAASVFLAWPRSAAPPTDVWASIPLELGPWQGSEGFLSEREYEVLGTRDVLVRTYRNGDADQVQLTVVLAQQMRRRSHPPEQCLTGEGYILAAVREQALAIPGDGGRRLAVRELILKRGQEARIAWYFFKSGPKLSTDYWSHQARVALRKLTDPQAADVLVRVDVSAPVEHIERARALLRDFLTEAAQPLLTQLP